MRYYRLTSPAGDELARVSRGTASYFDATTGRWIPDPLLAVEVHSSGDWRLVEPEDLPAGLAGDADQTPPGRKARTSRRGRHSRR